MDDVIGQRQWNKLAAGRQCAATSKQTGERCRNTPIVGGFVCNFHGGATPAVRKSARERLLAMVEPALDALLRALQARPPCAHCGRSDADRDPVVLRAAQLVLDRTGFHPTLAVEQAPPNPFADMSEDDIIERLEGMLATAKARRDFHRAHALPPAAEGFVIPDDDAAIPNDEQRNPNGNDTPDEP